MGYNGNNRKLRSDMFPKRETKRMTRLFSGLFANTTSPLLTSLSSSLLSLGTNEIFMNLPNVVYAIAYILVSIVFNSLLIGCIDLAIEIWDSVFGFVSIVLFIIPVAIWGACIYFTVLSIIDLIKWIKKKRINN